MLSYVFSFLHYCLVKIMMRKKANLYDSLHGLFRTQCTKKYNRVCTPWTETVCKTLNENVCETKYRDNCYEKYRDIKEPYEEDVCVDKDIAVCDKHWQCNNPNIPISDCNDKVWVDNKVSLQNLMRS